MLKKVTRTSDPLHNYVSIPFRDLALLTLQSDICLVASLSVKYSRSLNVQDTPDTYRALHNVLQIIDPVTNSGPYNPAGLDPSCIGFICIYTIMSRDFFIHWTSMNPVYAWL